MSTSGPRSARRLLISTGATAAAVVLVAACSSSKSGGGSPSSTPPANASTAASAASGGSTATSKDVTVDVRNFTFTPGDLTVTVGTKVTWKFDDSTSHTVKADNGAFTSSALNGGKTYSFTFNSAGTYNYICSIHPYMKGAITVK
jgi:plastocyanin